MKYDLRYFGNVITSCLAESFPQKFLGKSLVFIGANDLCMDVTMVSLAPSHFPGP